MCSAVLGVRCAGFHGWRAVQRLGREMADWLGLDDALCIAECKGGWLNVLLGLCLALGLLLLLALDAQKVADLLCPCNGRDDHEHKQVHSVQREEAPEGHVEPHGDAVPCEKGIREISAASFCMVRCHGVRVWNATELRIAEWSTLEWRRAA